MLDAWVALGLSPANVVVLEPQPSPDIAALTERGVRLNPPRDSVGDIAVAVLAVKPQIAPEVLAALAPFVAGATVVLSIMAGRTLRFLADNLPGAALVRAMPNTPAAIGRAITVAIANPRVSPEQRGEGIGRSLYERFFAEVGKQDRSLVRCVTSPANEESVAFHDALGFEVERVAKDYDGPGEDRVLLVKRLGSDSEV